jgi:hypothetical protein
MIQLKSKDYFKGLPLFDHVNINTMFARGLHDYMTNLAGMNSVWSGCKVIRQESGPLSLILLFGAKAGL